MTKLRVVHYVNQFFAGVGGEEFADSAPEVREGAVGPGLGLTKLFADDAEIVATVFCGDNYMAEGGDDAAGEVVDLIEGLAPDVLVAGPAFGSGRYGLACGAVSSMAQSRLGVPAVTGMFEDAPGAEQYRAEIVIIPTKETAAGMGAALPELARLAVKLGHGKDLAPPAEDGYLSKGLRFNMFAAENGAVRAVDMLLAKLAGDPFTTEWPLPRHDPVEPAEPLKLQKGIKVALVTETGVVPKGNPDGLPSGWAKKWVKYDLSGVHDLTGDSYESVHGGIDTAPGNEDPDRLVPLDALRALEATGDIEVHEVLYSTTGNMGSLPDMRRIGSEMAVELFNAGVEAVIVGGT